MGQAQRAVRPYAAGLALTALLLGVGALGYLSFLAFVRGILAPGEFAGYGLAIVAVSAGAASFFSPCSFTVLPSYLAFTAGAGRPGEAHLAGTLRTGAVAAAGVAVAVTAVGLLVAALGTAFGADLSIAGDEPSALARVLRIGVGAFVLALGALHILDLSHRAPFVGRIAAWAVRAQPEGTSSRSVFAYGAAYVVVGVG